VTEEKTFIDNIARLMADALPNARSFGGMLRCAGEEQMMRFLKWARSQNILHSVLEPAMRSDLDTVTFEYRLPTGIADIVVFDIVGEATVIEVKDGAQGFRSVVGGIGQAGLYAAQLDPAGALKVRRALVWTPVTEPDPDRPRVNRLIEDACKLSGVVPVFIPPVDMIARATGRVVLDGLVSTMYGGCDAAPLR
jgi:hypothetical protein